MRLEMRPCSDVAAQKWNLDFVSMSSLSHCHDASYCNWRGDVSVLKGSCSCACRNQWSGDRCETCPLGWTGADCNLTDYCSNEADCSGHGVTAGVKGYIIRYYILYAMYIIC